MKLLLDECLDWRLARHLAGHEVRSANRIGWAGLPDGRLLTLAAEAGFAAFVTLDRNLAFQQALHKHPIAVIVIRAPGSKLAVLQAAAPKILAALERCRSGEVIFLDAR